MPKVEIIPSDEFRRQAKRLLKKHKTLPDDLAELQQILLKDPCAGFPTNMLTRLSVG